MRSGKLSEYVKRIKEAKDPESLEAAMEYLRQRYGGSFKNPEVGVAVADKLEEFKEKLSPPELGHLQSILTYRLTKVFLINPYKRVRSFLGRKKKVKKTLDELIQELRSV